VAATPVPVRLICSGEFGALLESEIDPETVVVELGMNTALKLALLPAWIVSGVVSPVVLNPVPATMACEIVKVVFPPFEMLIGCETFVPVTTFPKATLEGLAPICAWMPVPLSAMVAGEFGALLVIETLPEALPAAVGANCTANVVPSPGFSVSGTGRPERVNPVPEALATEMVSATFPEFVSVMFCDVLLPTLTFPKLTLVVVNVSCA